jgi:hypothetical protein
LPATGAGKGADVPIRPPYNGRMDTRIPVEPGKACLLPNHGPVTRVSNAHAGRRKVMAAAWADPRQFSDGRWHFAEVDGRTIHYCGGGQFFANGEAFEA